MGILNYTLTELLVKVSIKTNPTHDFSKPPPSNTKHYKNFVLKLPARTTAEKTDPTRAIIIMDHANVTRSLAIDLGKLQTGSIDN